MRTHTSPGGLRVIAPSTTTAAAFRSKTLPGCASLHKTILATFLCCSAWQGFTAVLILDDFAYPSSTSARAAWSGSGGPPVTMSSSGEWGNDQVMVLNCDFSTRSSRCYWDRNVSLNLAPYSDFELEVFTPDPSPISQFTLYFRSGSGWYSASASLRHAGWQTLRFSLGNFIPEGTPAGWGQINGIRLSPWKLSAQDTYLAVRQLRAVIPSVLLVRDTDSTNPEIVRQSIDRHIAWLGGFGIHCGETTRAGVEAGLLAGSQLAILPYNESVSEAEMLQYESFVASGGKLIVYYLLPGRLAQLLGVRVLSWTPGDFATWVFADPKTTNLPPRVSQASWNITAAEPNGSFNSRVTARWENSLGQNTGKAAWIGSDRGFFMSHVLLGDDADNKSYALLCLVGSILPEVWPAAAAGAINDMGKVAAYLSYEEALSDIRARAATTLRALLVEAELAASELARAQAMAHQAAGRYSEAIFSARSARSHLRQAYMLGLQPAFPEFRAIWEHHAEGPFPGNWAAAAANLASNQFHAVFPNMLWGGLAHYNSAYLPRSAKYNSYGDQIAACVAACHAQGVQVHVWKVNWNLLGAPQSFIDSMRTANRTQVSQTGEPIDWLCPSHPDNLALETNSMLEVVRNYDVDGIHFDYIRYPDSTGCYCSGCATRFQAQTGRTVVNWPADVLAAGTLRAAFLNWRRAQITRLVEAVYVQTKALKPSVKVSAAVFPDPTSAYDEVGQDWRLWVTNGILDFVCPMDYTTEYHNFTNTVAQQLKYVAGKMPVYPGIGAFILETDGTLAQVQATRAAKTRGFILFELSPTSAATLLPAMRLGATAPDEPDYDQDSLPDSWEQRWFGTLNTAGASTDSDGDELSDRAEYIAGTSPTNSGSGVVLEIRVDGQKVRAMFSSKAIEGVGYQNAERHYSIEISQFLGDQAAWTPLSGYSDLIPNPDLTSITCPITPEIGTTRFYRLRVWLQQRR